MHTSDYIYYHGQQELHGYLAYQNENDQPRPAVLIFHDWSGRNDFACKKAEMLANMGYIGFAIDMYGQACLGETNDEKQALMTPLAHDRLLLRDRARAALDALKQRDGVDCNRIAAIGFCFGGLCALDLARSGADMQGAISFHGLLNKPQGLPTLPISAKILVLHGYDDPMVPPEQVHSFCQEMTDAGADWQVHMYGHTKHAFTNPLAHDEAFGLIYNKQEERRSWLAMTNFLQEMFQ